MNDNINTGYKNRYIIKQCLERSFVLHLYITLSKVLDYRITQPARRIMKTFILSVTLLLIAIGCPSFAKDDTKQIFFEK